MVKTYTGSYNKWKTYNIVLLIGISIFIGGFSWLFFGHFYIVANSDSTITAVLLVFTLVLIVPQFVSLIQICCKLIKKDIFIINYKTDPYPLAIVVSIIGTVLLIPSFILFKIYSLTLIIAFSLSLTGTLTTAIIGLLVDANYKYI